MIERWRSVMLFLEAWRLKMSVFRSLSMAAGPPIAAALLLTASAASAGTLSYSGFTVTGDSIAIDTPVATTGVAGLIHLVTTSGIINAWCIDVYDSLSGSGTYNIAPVTGPLPDVPALTSAQIGEIGALMVHGDQLVGAPPPGDTADDVATAIQVAIWSIEYGAGFTYNYVDPAVASLAPLYSADATSGAWKPFTQYAALSGTGPNQTLGAVVPEASTWEMMLLGFAGLGFAGFRASRKSVALAA
jgi:hypothetical protein